MHTLAYVGLGLGFAAVFIPHGVLAGIMGCTGLWAVWYLMRNGRTR